MPLHSRNLHQGRYDLALLCQANPSLMDFVRQNPRGEPTVDFANPKAVLQLNKALLRQYYGILQWHVPKGFLCPPIPGRVDYIHYLADLLAQGDDIPRGKSTKVLDIGTGANLIYPILGNRSYGWSFVGTDIHTTAVKAAKLTVQSNPCLKRSIKVFHQKLTAIFTGVIQPDDTFALTMCNPPFYKNEAQATAANSRKRNNLSRRKKPTQAPIRNFGGQANELWCNGGEMAFLAQMAKESVAYGKQVGWFTSLVASHEHLPKLQRILNKLQVRDMRVIDMAQGQKTSRFIAWRF